MDKKYWIEYDGGYRTYTVHLENGIIIRPSFRSRRKAERVLKAEIKRQKRREAESFSIYYDEFGEKIND